MEWPLQRHPLSRSHGQICSHHRCPPTLLPLPLPLLLHSLRCPSFITQTHVRAGTPALVQELAASRAEYMQVLSRKEKRGGKGRAGVGEGKRWRCHPQPPPPLPPIRERTTAVEWSRTKEGWRVGQKGETPGRRRRGGLEGRRAAKDAAGSSGWREAGGCRNHREPDHRSYFFFC